MDDVTEPVEFQNDQITAFVLRKPSCLVELKVKASPLLIQKARGEALKAIGKEVLFPGFRKGKAPKEIVQKKYPKEIEKETRSQLADIAFAEAQKWVKIPLLNRQSRITFDLQKMGEEGAELVFTFETEPVVPTIDPRQFRPEPIKRSAVGEVEIDEAIRQMQFFFATWKPIMDRSIQEKDYVMIDLDTFDGETTQRVFHQVRFEVSKERMAEWMQKLILGTNVGDVLDGISEPDAHATEEEKKEFQPKKVRITILKLEEAAVPALDEEFANKVGARDLVHMRQSVTDMLNRQAHDKVQGLLREQINRFLIEHYPFEIPQSLIGTEKEHRTQQLFQNPDFKRDWEKMSEEERGAFNEKMNIEATNAVRLFYISRQMVRDANIGITHKEVQDEAVATLQASGMQQQIPLDQLPKELYALALSKVILARAQDLVLQINGLQIANF